jgi:hypothetical protein
MSTPESGAPAFADDFSPDGPAISRDKRELDWKARVLPLEPSEDEPAWVKEAVSRATDDFSQAELLALKLLSSSAWDFVYLLLLFVWVVLVGQALDSGESIDASAATAIPAIMVLAVALPSAGGLWFALAREQLLTLCSIEHVTKWVRAAPSRVFPELCDCES